MTVDLPETTRDIITVDLDSTLADTGHRQHMLIEAQEKGLDIDWAAYAAKCSEDVVVQAVATLTRILSTSHDIHIVSGRDGSAEKATVAWLDKHAIPFLRLWLDNGEHDGLLHTEYKLQLIQRVEEDTGQKVILHIDDWDNVAAHLSANGYPTICVRTPQEIASAT